MVVSKKQSAGIRFFTVEGETGRKGAAQLPQAFYGFLSAPIAANLEAPGTHGTDFDLISLFQVEGFGHHRGQPNGETVSPFGDAHFPAP
jgi:hypothetical protein